jgi:hypothetical protein
MYAQGVSRRRTGTESPAAEVAAVVFTELHGKFAGTGQADRRWRVLPVRTGWRLEFRDPGAGIATYAGTYATASQAQREAA